MSTADQIADKITIEEDSDELTVTVDKTGVGSGVADVVRERTENVARGGL